MNNKINLIVLLTGIFLLTLYPRVNSQVIVEKSKDKVIISGVPYYVHQVKKGETAYSISKAYGITVEELTRENPPALYGVKEGQALRIPFREISEKTVTEPEPARQRKDESKFIYHRLQPGETVYSISKLYDVPEHEIISSNSGIDITRLSVGAEIAVPRREFMNERQEFATQEGNYIFHKVVRGESLAAIAEKYGLTVRELRKENRNVRFPQVGDYLRIPVAKQAEPQITEIPGIDTVKVPEENPVVVLNHPSGYTPVKNLKGTFDLAVLLPLYLQENSSRTYIDSSKTVKGKKIQRIVNRPEEWIYYQSPDFIEMYEGILLATDTLRALGLNINIHVFDTKGDTIEVKRLIRSGKLADMDLIIGPVYSSNLTIMTAYAGSIGIPVVSPVQLINDSALVNNPNLFMANSSLEIPQKAIARKVSEYYDKNIVFIHTDSAGVDPDVRRFKEAILNELSNRLPFEEIKFKEFLFYSRSAFNNDSINRLSHALSSKTDNIIIIATEEGPVISETLQEIHALSKKMPMKVFGYPVLRSLNNLEPKFIFDLDILVYSPYWIDYSKRDVKKFNDDFRQKFLTEPSEVSYAWLGYDIAYYFLSGLAIHGKDFLEHPEMHNPDLLQTEFDFQRKRINDGFENQKLFPVRYTKLYEVKLESDTNPDQ